MSIALSIIIPTLNRANYLEKTLESIACQTQKTIHSEVIVIDNGSTDNTKVICNSFKEKINNLVYLFDDEPGLLTGRHKGAEIAKGETLCFLDDDVILNPAFVINNIRLFSENTDVKLATGPCLPNYEIEPPKWLNYFWETTSQGQFCSWLSLLDFGQEQIEIDPNFVWGLNFSIRKQTFIELDGFHPDCIPGRLQQYQGDGETGLTLKAKNKNYWAFYEPGISLMHQVPTDRLTEAYFKKRAFYQGVCNSFTSIRNLKIGIPKNPPFKSLRDKLHPYYRWIKKIYEKEVKIKLPEDIKELMITLDKSGQDGFDFHQYHFNNDERVKKWVLKENYWDYKLPTK